jgi:hypothetical protein
MQSQRNTQNTTTKREVVLLITRARSSVSIQYFVICRIKEKRKRKRGKGNRNEAPGKGESEGPNI